MCARSSMLFVIKYNKRKSFLTFNVISCNKITMKKERYERSYVKGTILVFHEKFSELTLNKDKCFQRF